MAAIGPKIGRELSFFSAWFCPFAQRTWIALEEKGVSYKHQEVAIKDPDTGLWKQLDQKPEWFLRLNPFGKVPTLAYQEDNGNVRSVYESTICNEFLEDFAPPPDYTALFPRHPMDKAHARLLIESFDRKFIPHFYGILLKASQEDRDTCARKLVDYLGWLESQIDRTGPYFLGKEFSAVDCTILPWFIRLYVLKHYRGFELPKECKQLVAWYNKTMVRESVQATLKGPNDDEGYEHALLQHYSKYADGSANSTSAADFR